jgi:hypothetical protein
MSGLAIVIIVLSLGVIVGGIMVLKKSARNFNLTKEQLESIKQRENEQQSKDQD